MTNKTSEVCLVVAVQNTPRISFNVLSPGLLWQSSLCKTWLGQYIQNNPVIVDTSDGDDEAYFPLKVHMGKKVLNPKGPYRTAEEFKTLADAVEYYTNYAKIFIIGDGSTYTDALKFTILADGKRKPLVDTLCEVEFFGIDEAPGKHVPRTAEFNDIIKIDRYALMSTFNSQGDKEPKPEQYLRTGYTHQDSIPNNHKFKKGDTPFGNIFFTMLKRSK
ncbi:MAG: hypothetical protein FWE17_02495 [Alphaproteobacteria bacterium]|jgi:hypothetical protein|nr:hypothetical protein [Alphaproteobacteria bacterium]MCL2758115.1 hypothetical protein [Alphaproteobacteria bacterium]